MTPEQIKRAWEVRPKINAELLDETIEAAYERWWNDICRAGSDRNVRYNAAFHAGVLWAATNLIKK